MSKNVEFWKFLIVCLMEVFGGVWGWVEVSGAAWGWVEVFGGVSGWLEVRVFWAGRSRFWLVPIGDFDIFCALATRREMSRNVAKCREMSKNVEFCQILSKSLMGGTFLDECFVQMLAYSFFFLSNIFIPFFWKKA